MCETLPLSPTSPTDWTGLYTALKQAQGINMKVSQNKENFCDFRFTTLCKIYGIAYKNEIKDNFIFKLGELHIVFAFLKVLGKYFNFSGLDQILVDTETYGL